MDYKIRPETRGSDGT